MTAEPKMRNLLVAAPVLLTGISMPACLLPARRAARMDPMRSLREE